MQTLRAAPRRLTLLEGASGKVRVTNRSNQTIAYDIQAFVNQAGLSDFVSVTRGIFCDTLPPRKTCELTFFATEGTTGLSPTVVPIQGKNTSPTQFILTISPATRALITLKPNIVVVDAGGSASMTVTNESFLITADRVTATPLPSGVSVNTCRITPRTSCTLTFTAASTTLSSLPQRITIAGTNTTTAYGSIAINNPSLVPLSVTGTPLQLAASTSTSGTMTVTNNSTLNQTAIGVSADLSSTNLNTLLNTSYSVNGTVSSTSCPAFKANETCTITFTPSGTTVEGLTTFNIVGVNTETVTAQISLGSYLAYIAGDQTPGSGGVVVCNIATGGSLSNCVSTGSTAYTTGLGKGLAINDLATFLYGAPYNFYIVDCSITPGSGALSCSNAVTLQNEPNGLSYYSALNILYATGNNASGQEQTSYLCTLDTDGTATSCAASGAYNYIYAGLDANQATNSVFITSGYSSSNNIYQYPINSSGYLNPNGLITFPLSFSPYAIKINSAGTYAYITNTTQDDTAKVAVCSIKNGKLNTCNNSTVATGLTYGGTFGIVLNEPAGTAYVESFNGTSDNDAVIYVCSITNGGSTLSSCQYSSAVSNIYIGAIAIYPPYT